MPWFLCFADSLPHRARRTENGGVFAERREKYLIRGLYTAASGMAMETLRTDVTANNLANANTAGYKRDRAVAASFSEMLIRRINDHVYNEKPLPSTKPAIGRLGTGVQVQEVFVDYAPGLLRETGNPLDLAIEGDGFFQLLQIDANGNRNTFFTRNGSFTLNNNGELVDSAGNLVLGANGAPLVINRNAAEVVVNTDGTIIADGVEQGRVMVIRLADPSVLEKVEGSLFRLPAGTAGNAVPFAGTIRQGMLENANLNPVTEMVQMITQMRAYEANQKMIKAHDETLGKAINEVGKPA